MKQSFVLCAALAALTFATAAPAKLVVVVLTPEAKAKADEAKAKAAWSDKVAAYKLCEVQNRVADRYRSEASAAGKTPAHAVSTPPCSDPGPFTYVAANEGQKPIEASGAHSPAETAIKPPSTEKPAAETKPSTKQ